MDVAMDAQRSGHDRVELRYHKTRLCSFHCPELFNCGDDGLYLYRLVLSLVIQAVGQSNLDFKKFSEETQYL